MDDFPEYTEEVQSQYLSNCCFCFCIPPASGHLVHWLKRLLGAWQRLDTAAGKHNVDATVLQSGDAGMEAVYRCGEVRTDASIEAVQYAIIVGVDNRRSDIYRIRGGGHAFGLRELETIEYDCNHVRGGGRSYLPHQRRMKILGTVPTGRNYRAIDDAVSSRRHRLFSSNPCRDARLARGPTNSLN